jgi:hypothetical protein
MTTRDEFAARVPDAVQRREALALWQAFQDAADAADAACDGGIEAIDAKYKPLYEEAQQAFLNRKAEIDAQRRAELEGRPLQIAADAAEKAWHDHPTPEFERDHDEAPILCALSGLPIFEDDAVLKDTETGEVVLKACLGVPLDEADDRAFAIGGDGGVCKVEAA